MKPIYVLHPGKIRLRNGKIEHFSCDELAELYKVELNECLVYNPLRSYISEGDLTFIHLRPRADENYSLKGRS